MVMPKNPWRDPRRQRFGSRKPPVAQKQLPPPPQVQTADCGRIRCFGQPSPRLEHSLSERLKAPQTLDVFFSPSFKGLETSCLIVGIEFIYF